MKKGAKHAIGLVGTSIVLSAGSSIAPSAGLTNMASSLPIAGSIAGAGMSIRMLKGMKKR